MRTLKILMAMLMLLSLAGICYAALPVLNPIGNKILNENSTIQFNVAATYTGTDLLVFSVSPSLPAGAVFSKINNLVYSFTWTPDYTQAGSYPLQFRVYESLNTSSADTEDMTITVQNVNRPPTITPGSLTLASDETSKTLSVSYSDPDGETPTFTITNQENTSIAQCYLDGSTLRAERASSAIWTATKVTHCTVEVKDPYNAVASAVFTINVDPKSMLEIDRLDVVVNSKTDRLDNGDEFDAEIGDSLEFKLTVRNLYTGDTNEEEIDIENVNVRITIESWSDGDDEYWENTKDIDIKYDSTGKFTISLDSVPIDTDDGSHTVTIKVEGRDSEHTSVRHIVEWKVDMNVDKQNEDIQIPTAVLEPSVVSCERTSILNIKLTNAGTSDSDEIVFDIKNTALGLSVQDYDIELNEGDSITREYTIAVSDRIAPGVYPIRVSTYFDMDTFDDKDVSNTKNVQLTVEKCVTEVPPVVPPVVPKKNDTEQVVVIPPTTPPVTPPVTPTPTEKGIFGDNIYIVGGLVLLNLLLLIAIFVIIIKLVTK